MARKKRPAAEPSHPDVSQALVILIGVLLLVVECIMVPGLSSVSRLPKIALLVGIVAVLAGMSVAARLIRTGRFCQRSRLAACLLAYPALQALSMTWSARPRLSFSAALISLGIVVTTLWMASLKTAQRRLLIRFVAVGTVISCAVVTLQYLGFSPMDVKGWDREALSGLTGSSSDLAAAIVLLLPLLLFAGRDGISHRKFHWALAIVLSVSVFVTQSLTGSAAVIFFWLIVLLNFRKSRTAWTISVVAVLMIAVLAGATKIDGRVRRVARQVAKGKIAKALTSRTDGWLAGSEMFRSSPLLGVGAANYSYAYYPNALAYLERTKTRNRRGETSTHFEWAHNDPLQVCAELGTIGAAWLAWLAFSIVSEGRRKTALLIAAAATYIPFLILQYPTHIAVGLIPTMLLLAELISSPSAGWTSLPKALRIFATVFLLLAMFSGSLWALRQCSHSKWMYTTNAQFKHARSLKGEQREMLVARVEADSVRYATLNKAFAAEALLIVGQCRLLRYDLPGAEAALRESFDLWPHEAAEIGLGLTLAAQGRQSEAIPHLANLVRVNGKLRRLIPDPELERAVDAYINARTR